MDRTGAPPLTMPVPSAAEKSGALRHPLQELIETKQIEAAGIN